MKVILNFKKVSRNNKHPDNIFLCSHSRHKEHYVLLMSIHPSVNVCPSIHSTFGFCSITLIPIHFYYTPRNEVVGGYTGFTISVCLQTNPMCDNLSCVSQNLLKFYQLFTGEERRIPFIFDDFHFCRSRVIELDMTENRIFTLCRMIT